METLALNVIRRCLCAGSPEAKDRSGTYMLDKRRHTPGLGPMLDGVHSEVKDATIAAPMMATRDDDKKQVLHFPKPLLGLPLLGGCLVCGATLWLRLNRDRH